MKCIGVLALQGSIIEHIHMLHQMNNVKVVQVKTEKNLQQIDGLILPGGESTTIGLLLNQFNLLTPIREKIKEGLPVWGTCAGMVLLANEIENQGKTYLRTMAIKVKRNAYGSQLNSFRTREYISILGKEMDFVFIRAPYVLQTEDHVDILCTNDNKITAVKENNMLATSFHPELSDDLSFHHFFVQQMA